MIILCGPSATGKTEIAKKICEKYGLKKVVTHTTRPIRIHEVNNIDYHFVTEQEFHSMIDKNDFVEYIRYNHHYYGSSKKEIGDNKCCILEPNGAVKYKNLNDNRIVIFYLIASEETRIQRMNHRQDSKENIQERIENDRKAFKSQEQIADFVIKTDEKDINQLVDEIYSLYQKKLGLL